MIEVLDLFSAAAGGWSLGMHRAGFSTIAACEVEAWRRALYSENNPGVKVYDDVRTLTADRLLADLGRLPTIVVGSPPCQDISSANTKGRGVEGERSGLYFEAIRIIDECRPRWFALENSSNLRTRGADAVLTALEAIGYACWPVVVRAGDIGANHERPRCWLIGCDLAQVTDPDGFGSIGFGRRRLGLDVSVSDDPLDASGIGHEGGRARRYGQDGLCAAPVARSYARHSQEDGRRPGVQGRCAEPVEGISVAACRHDADAVGKRPQGQPRGDEQREGQEPERADISARRKMGLCSPDSSDADRGGSDWSLDDLADHLRVDDGLSAWLAGTRVTVGDGKGQSAASLVVEAFGDAVIPQIPEAIGRAILRTEAALRALYTPNPETIDGRC